jgi:hypothetical protein
MLKVTVRWLALLHIWEFLGSNHSPETTYFGFPQFFQANAGICPSHHVSPKWHNIENGEYKNVVLEEITPRKLLIFFV